MYKCPSYGTEERFICKLTNLHSIAGAKRVTITFCSGCHRYYFYVSSDWDVSTGRTQVIQRIELTDEEAIELMEKIRSCSDPRDAECTCPVHKFIDAFENRNRSRKIAI